VIERRRSARHFDTWEGQHLAYGGAHAEVNALPAAGEARGATVYVSLEPCTTTGKTGPCVDALVKAGVRRVVWAVADPNPAHRGKAAAALRAHGIVAEGPAYRTDPFPDLTLALRRSLASDRPWVLAKWAQSLDGKLAFERGMPASISGAESWREVHELRGRVEAVAVGVGTVLADDPRLDCRLPDGPPDGRSQPAAVVFDSRLRTPIGSKLVRGASLARPLHLYVAAAPARRQRAFAHQAGVVITELRGRNGRVDLARALAHLRAQGCRRLLVEGGGTLTGSLLAAGLVDQVAAIVAPFFVGDAKAPSLELPAGARARGGLPRLEWAHGRRIGDDVWIEGYVAPKRRTSPAGRTTTR
jgi:diaminohydroxyphosphoribosylaminopyrimidine deaminase/5-amino-6-(5-phosphoribosylamino)uracil reductase